MARKEGLKPIGESLKPIIERIKKEREERRKKNKPIRTQPKLPGMKNGGSMEKQRAKDMLKGLAPKIVGGPIGGRKKQDPNKDKRSPGRPGGKGKKEDKRRKIRYMTPVAKKAQGGIAFGGEKRIPGSGAAFRGTGFKGIF